MNPSIRVKICGITNQEDALAAIDAGADALGFNLYSGSRRHVRIEDALSWLPGLGGHALRVAVMVNPSAEELVNAQRLFDAVQLHGQEDAALCAEAAARGTVWKAFPLAGELSTAAVAAFRAHAILIDSAGPTGPASLRAPHGFGGAGALIDLDGAANFVRGCPGRTIWLSGGLTPFNVALAIQKVRPFGVDVASGVEAPGNSRRKDSSRVRAFIEAARGA